MKRSSCSAMKALSNLSFVRSTHLATFPMSLAVSSTYLPSMLTAQRFRSTNNIPKIGNKRQVVHGFNARNKEYEGVEDLRPIEEIAAGIDTTLTPAQRVYVDMLKKKISGGPKSQKIRSPYRDIATVDNIVESVNLFPKMAVNAQELIDFALSKIPVKTGPRRSRRKKRAALKYETKRKFDKIKKMQNAAANKRIQATLKKDRVKAKAYRAEALVINAAREKWQKEGLAKVAARAAGN